ncbi:MAG: rhamnulokinase [Planctomycetota bacterium]|jgi:sugar (pentulose or hexulose) kinase|nr:rhamnulokinase [Planctomycetota bacterium]
MTKTLNLVAIDCGNSSCRAVLGRFDGSWIAIESVLREENRMIRVGDVFYWDILNIFHNVKRGIAEAAKRAGDIDAIGICTWGVDFALFDAGGGMLANPLSYRNEIGAAQLEAVSGERRRALYEMTGIVCDRINSVYMLQGMRRVMPGVVDCARRLLMVSDILNYFLTGIMANEPSELSTTQLLSARDRQISAEACADLDVDNGLFGYIPEHGSNIGFLLSSVRDELGLANDVPVISVPSHDTAAAVLAVPAGNERFAFVSSGTWSLIGVELEEPVINDAAYRAGLTNEVGAFNRITLLRNHAGLYIIQRLREEYEREFGVGADWDVLLGLAKAYEGEPPIFPVNHGDFFNPTHMAATIWRHLRERFPEQGPEPDWTAILAAYHHSMARSYAEVVKGIEEASGETIERLHIVGGGVKNVLLNQLAANYTGLQVMIGSPDSTSFGNLAAQVKYFEPSLGIRDLRDIVARSIVSETFDPQ